MTAIAIAGQDDSLGGKLVAVIPHRMLQKRRARLWLADVEVNTAASRHLTVPCHRHPPCDVIANAFSDVLGYATARHPAAGLDATLAAGQGGTAETARSRDVDS